MAKLGFFKLGTSGLGGLRTIGRALKARLFTRSYRDMAVETKSHLDVATETKSYRDASSETREVEL